MTATEHHSVSRQSAHKDAVRHDWTIEEAARLLAMPFNDLMFRAQTTHRQFFSPNEVQVSTLLSIKTGACPEDCKYCPQSGHYHTDQHRERLLEVQKVLDQAEAAKAKGASRFCMGAAWSNPKQRDMPYIIEMVRGVKALGLETCMTLGSLSEGQATELSAAGLDYYNHNLDTSPEYYGQIITTRTFQDRLDTLAHVRRSGMKICSGGIIGMGETDTDRAGLLVQLANLSEHPESVPINMLVKVQGTPLAHEEDVDPIDFVRIIAAARIMMPASHVRLSAGRQKMSDEMQALCFLAGANSVFYGDRLLTTGNPETDRDQLLFQRLGLKPEQHRDVSDEAHEAALLSAVEQSQQADLYYAAD